MPDVKWGIIGCGGIAATFVSSLRALEEGSVLAGASRTPGRALAFATKHGIARSYTDYESLVSDPDIDAVYVATTHNFHHDNVRLCLEHGKHVLCEKPLTLNATQAKELAGLAKAKNLFLMEALWTRFLPAIQQLQQLLAEGMIGDVQMVKADFCIGQRLPAKHRLRNKALAGGALLDLGIYPISMASIVYGRPPVSIQGSAIMDKKTGVDEISEYRLDYGDGQTAELSASYSKKAPVDAVITGSNGFIRIPHFLGANELQIHRNGQPAEVLNFPYGDGEHFKYEIAHAMECIAAGQTESDIMPLSKTIEIMETMDTLRRQWNLVYPDETP